MTNHITPATYAICAVCHQPMTFLEYADHTHTPRLVLQSDPGDEPEPVYEVLEFDPYGRGMYRGASEVVVRTRFGETRTSTRYLRVVR